MASLALSNENEQSNFVSIHTVDKSIFANFSIEHNKKYILKVDVEGFELTVLKEIFESTDLLIAVHSEDEKIINNNLRLFKSKFGDTILILTNFS